VSVSVESKVEVEVEVEAWCGRGVLRCAVLYSAVVCCNSVIVVCQ
jgi:hypothetical protein